MHMVCHEAIGMDTMLEFFFAILKKKEKSASILFFKKDLIAGVSPQDNAW
jgi:hypothetical protein